MVSPFLGMSELQKNMQELERNCTDVKYMGTCMYIGLKAPKGLLTPWLLIMVQKYTYFKQSFNNSLERCLEASFFF